MRDKVYYFTFGARQTHDGCYVIVHAESAWDARKIMFSRFGQMWSGQYSRFGFEHMDLQNRMELLSTYEKGQWTDAKVNGATVEVGEGTGRTRES